MEIIPVEISKDPRRIAETAPILVAHQPEFLPYLGNIAKATMGDVYVLLDTVQFEKQHWQSRNRIRVNSPEGWQWLIIQLKAVGNHMMNTNEVLLDGDFWKNKHLKAIQMSYSKSPCFKTVFAELSEVYNRKHVYLVDFLVDLIQYAFTKFDIHTPVYRSSELAARGYDLEGKKSEHLVNISRCFAAKTFLFGRDGATYADRELFSAAGILPVFQDFHHPEYSQVHPGPFQPYMSFIDLLFNHEPDARNILGKCGYTK
jgi:hypothetical protein